MTIFTDPMQFLFPGLVPGFVGLKGRLYPHSKYLRIKDFQV